jgi:hypothetical protein
MSERTTQRLLIVFSLLITSLVFAAAPSDLSIRGIVDWAQVGGHIASGTGALPAVASEGARYTDLSTPSAPIEYRSNGSSWVAISGAGGTGSATTDHAALTNLDFSSSGHTGFASSGALAAIDGRVSADEASLSAHVDNQTDPHGASMTISQDLFIGSGTADAFISRSATGTITIATWARIVPSVASPTIPATGTIWQDASGCYRIYDSHGSWSAILTDYPVWQDLRVSLLSTNAGGTNPPTPVKVVGSGSSQGVFAYSFDAGTEEEVYASIQLPHDIYKTYVSPHLHWCPQSTNVATVTLGIEYSLANYLATYPTTTIATLAVLTPGVDRKHMITELPAINISGAKDSAVMLIRIFRAAADAGDTYAQEVFLTDFDLHYQVKNRGSERLYGDN